MNDVLYTLGSVAFFGLMLAYVAGCAYLGRPEDDMSPSRELRS